MDERDQFYSLQGLGNRAESIYAGLINNRILIKCLHRADSALDNCLRVTIGRQDENDAFLSALSELL